MDVALDVTLRISSIRTRSLPEEVSSRILAWRHRSTRRARNRRETSQTRGPRSNSSCSRDSLPRETRLNSISSPPRDQRRVAAIELGETPVVVGRDSHLDIALAGTDISRRHSIASVMEGAVVVEDLGIDQRHFHRRPASHAPRAALPVGASRVGDHTFRCERRGRREMLRAVEQHRDLERAANYVRSLLAPPLPKAPCVPSGSSGHRLVSAAMLQLRSARLEHICDLSHRRVRAWRRRCHALGLRSSTCCGNGRCPLPTSRIPMQVFTELNAMFQMERHDASVSRCGTECMTRSSRTLRYASAGHHPGLPAGAGCRRMDLRSRRPD